MSTRISPAVALTLLRAGAALAVDVREAGEYAAGHLPGAVNLPLGLIAARAGAVLPAKNTLLLVYCRTGRRAAAAARELKTLGYTNVRELGGITAWPYQITKT